MVKVIVSPLSLWALLRAFLLTLLPANHGGSSALWQSSLLLVEISDSPHRFLPQIFLVRAIVNYLRQSYLFEGKFLILAVPLCHDKGAYSALDSILQAIHANHIVQKSSHERLGYWFRLTIAAKSILRSFLSLIGGILIALFSNSVSRSQAVVVVGQSNRSKKSISPDCNRAAQLQVMIDLDHTLIDCNSAQSVLSSILPAPTSRTTPRIDSLIGLPAESLALYRRYSLGVKIPKLKHAKLKYHNIKLTNDILRLLQSQDCVVSTLSMPFCLSRQVMDGIRNAMQVSVGFDFPLFNSLSEVGNLSGVYKYSTRSTILITDSPLDIRRFFPIITLLI